MHLNIDFSGLEQAAQRMGATAPIDLVISCGHGIKAVDPETDVQADLVEVDLPEVKRDDLSGLLTYRGSHVVLYIQDQGQRILDVLVDESKGPKVHVADCRTLREMRDLGRYGRYVATNNVSDEFHVTGQDEYGQKHEKKFRLRVCKNCLGMLNYKGYNTNRERVFRTFDWSEFFDTYATHFTRLPGRRADDPDTYTES